MDKKKPVHTVEHIEKQINTISSNLGDISPEALKKQGEGITAKGAKKKAFYEKHKKRNSSTT